MSFHPEQSLDCVYVERGEWELFAAIVEGHSENEERQMLNLPLLFARRLVQEVEYMRTVWARPATVSQMIKEGIELSRRAHSETEASR